MSFLRFAEEHGLIIDNLIEGRWVRTKTIDKPRKRNGSYKFMVDFGIVRNFATMEHVAIWRPTEPTQRIDRGALRERLVKDRRRQESLWLEARNIAEDMMQRAGVMHHPYLERKGFSHETGFVLDGELLVPMRDFHDYAQVNSLQRIWEDGTKKFLPGGKAQGSAMLLGNNRPREKWLVEGYATGLSVRAALKDLHREAQVIVCFSATNLIQIAKHVRGVAYVMADNDASGTGARAAASTGLPWIMPPEQGYDANDLHQKHGLRALVKLVLQLSSGTRWAQGAAA
jgi:putative DNA primase/helicase